MTPRTAHSLAIAGDLLADVCRDQIMPSATPPDDRHTETALRDLLYGWDVNRIHQLGAALDDIAAHLRDGIGRPLCTVTDHVALHFIVARARTLAFDSPELLRGRHLLLPPTRGDDDAFDRLANVQLDLRNITNGAMYRHPGTKGVVRRHDHCAAAPCRRRS